MPKAVSVADYMEDAVSRYYATRDPFGTHGDFITAPEISQIFGELIGAWISDQWQQAGSPQATLLELGPGRGTLMRDALRVTRNVPGFHDAITIALIENSPPLTAIQHQTLANAHPRTTWYTSFPPLPSTSTSFLAPAPLFFIANEFFDALPIRQFVGDVERKIVNGAFVPAGNVTRETCEAGQTIMRTLASHVARHGGAGLIIDYGYTGGSHKDTLQAIRRHEYADVLENPGETDLTAHVDFDALSAAARSVGATAHEVISQGDFLRRLGAELRATRLCKDAMPEQVHAILSGLERLVSPAQMGKLFKVLMVTA